MSVLMRTQAHLDLIAAQDPDIRSFIRVDGDDALAAANAADTRDVALSPLDGLLVAVKDNLAVTDKAWTAGIYGRRNLIADGDAAAITRLRAAGTVIVGGANMEEAALGAVTDNPTFGRCINPLGKGLTAGGSSGGSAAALAAGFVDLALGTDTMGSVRVPAAYCGVAGIKPTFGVIDRAGLAMLSPSLDTIGPMARDIQLLSPALRALSNPDFAASWPESAERSDLSGLTFGTPVQIREVECEAAVLRGLQKATEAIQRLGGDVIEIDLNGWRPGKSRRAGLLVTEAEGAVELTDLINEPGAISDQLRAMLNYGRNASAEKVAAAREEIVVAAQSVESAFAKVDAILMPTTPQRAFPHGDPIPANQADLTASANFSGCPAVALPVAIQGETLPASVQLLAARYADPHLLAWAEALTTELNQT
ncbi:MAG: amidase [Paracoccaceae bacterium]|nr:amidase [Paracoccaceae bacterium]